MFGMETTKYVYVFVIDSHGETVVSHNVLCACYGWDIICEPGIFTSMFMLISLSWKAAGLSSIATVKGPRKQAFRWL